ncbi:MAG: DciA family protein [Kiloniellaceae bacterium]
MPSSILAAKSTAKQAFVTATMSDSSSSRAATRRGSGLKALGGSLGPVTKRAFARRGLTGADIARQWPAIVGAELAAHCRPRQLRFPKAGEAVDGRLTLRVAPGWALEVQHLEPLVLERINSYFGYRAVARLVLQQGPLPRLRDGAGSTRREARRGPPPPLDGGLAAKLSTVADPALREALEGLGRSLREKRDRPPKKP